MRKILSKIVFFIIVSICLVLIALFPREAMVAGEGRNLWASSGADHIYVV